jgi:PadR family transcriptional regulator, regulatory protein PadR
MGSDPVRDAVEAAADAAPVERAAPDPLIGDLRRAGLLPLLVLHYVGEEPAYGNQLMDRISELTAGALNVNPNTMYPLLRALEERGLVEGRWEHPERRSRRFYAITPAGRREHDRLASELGPRLDRIAASIDAIRRAVL